MKKKWLLLSLIGFLVSCSKQESMDALTARVFTVAEQQYLTMDTRLESTTLAGFIPVHSGIFMSILKMKP